MKKIKLFFAALLAITAFSAFFLFPVVADAKTPAIVPVTTLAASSASEASAPEGSTTITILHTNDLHGRFVSSGTAIGFDTVGAIHAATPNSILVDAGDTIHGLPFVTLNQGVNAIQLMNAAGYSLFVPGNHDFNYGIDWLLLLETYAEFDFIASNLTWEEDGSSVFDEYNIVEIDGVRVGFFGLALPETPSVTSPLGVLGLNFLNPIEAARRSVVTLQAAEVDVIVALAHLGLDGNAWGREVARAVPEIDVIIDGHSHTRLDEGYWVGDVLVAQAGAHGQFVGAVEIVLHEGEIISRTASLIDREMSESFAPISEITALIDEMVAEVSEALNVVIGYSPVTLFGDDPEHRPALRSGEVPVGNLFADAMIWEADAQIAIMNSGGIRYHLHAGEITRHDMYQLHSFSNYVVAVEITPDVLFYALDVGVHQLGNGRFPQVGGFSFVFDNSQESGARIQSITLNDGTELDRNDTTTVIRAAISSFISTGGDNYTMLVDLPRVGEFGILQDVLAGFINYTDLNAFVVEGRIVDVTPTDAGEVIPQITPAELAPAPGMSDLVPHRYVDGVAFVAIRYAAEAYGAAVEWDESRRAVIITSATGDALYFVVGYRDSFIDSEISRTFVTVQHVSDVFGG